MASPSRGGVFRLVLLCVNVASVGAGVHAIGWTPSLYPPVDRVQTLVKGLASYDGRQSIDKRL